MCIRDSVYIDYINSWGPAILGHTHPEVLEAIKKPVSYTHLDVYKRQENIRFINDFSEKFGIQLEPIYTGKMMKKVFELIDVSYLPENSKILAFHTGGLQGIEGANKMLRKQKRDLIINRNAL